MLARQMFYVLVALPRQQMVTELQTSSIIHVIETPRKTHLKMT